MLLFVISVVFHDFDRTGNVLFVWFSVLEYDTHGNLLMQALNLSALGSISLDPFFLALCCKRQMLNRALIKF